MKKTAQTILTLSSISLFLVIWLLGFAIKTKAQSALGLTAIPPRLEVTVEPGEYVTKEIKIRNESTIEKIITTDVSDFIVQDNSGTPVKINTTTSDNRWAASNWIHVSESRIKIKPGETKSLMVTIIAPDNATAGGHYAMVLHNPNNEAVLSENSASIETNVGTLVYITIPGKIKQDAKIDEFMTPFKFQEYGPINFSTVISNLSDIHIKPQGVIRITNMLGLKTATVPFNEKEYNIFPLTSRSFDSKLNKKWLFGRYKAHIESPYGTAGGVLTATIFFWVIPWRLILLITAAIIIIVLLVLLFKKPDELKEKEETIDDLERELEKLKKKYKDLK